MKRIIAVIIIIAYLIQPIAFAISQEANETKDALNTAEKNMIEMIDAGLNVVRYNDTLEIAKQTYNAQVALETVGGKPQYSLVIEKISELNDIREKAFINLDEIKALDEAINSAKASNITEVIGIYNEAKNEFYAERYEASMKRVDLAYKKISELEAIQTKIKAIYDATSKSVKDFLNENWKNILITIASFAIAGSILFKKIQILRIKKEIKNLEIRRDAIKKLIAKTQKQYFEDGTLSETSYYIKTKKYGELIRDINRQIPIQKEMLARNEPKKTYDYTENNDPKTKKEIN